MPPVVAEEPKVFQPKNDIKTRHKVIRFGRIFPAQEDAEVKLYTFLHQRADLKVSQGHIPVGFLATFWLGEGQPVFLATRAGTRDGRGRPIGPQFQVTWKLEREVLGVASGEGWNANLDELWAAVLSHFERKNLLSEETLEYLDADPFVLFGIDDQITQQALLKLEKFPALLCEGAVPSFQEWSGYLRIPDDEPQLGWLVQAFAETDLPKPWTCYKGVGSIVCYIRSDTGKVTWKHPFYDYFRQLRDFCRQASPEEVMQVRCNRLLWSYEATRVETEREQDPLIAPEYIARMADIFGYDVRSQGFLVRNLKAQLKRFAHSYRQKQDISLAEVDACSKLLQRDVEKFHEMRSHWLSEVKEELKFDLNQLASAELSCVNCNSTALCFCLECKDYLCLACFDLLHSKGARLHHAPFRLVSCSLCVTRPAKLHCTFTDKSLCHECYAMKHIKMLPADGKENQPRRINYLQQYQQFAQLARDRSIKKVASLGFNHGGEESYESVLSTDWHPFYDSHGVKFYHNFNTGERMRQSPRRVPNTADPGAEEPEQLSLEDAATVRSPLPAHSSRW